MCMYAFVSIHDCIQIFVPWLLCIKLCSVTQQGIIDIKLTTSISFGFSGRPQLITILYLLCIYMFLCILCTYWNKILSYHMVLCAICIPNTKGMVERIWRYPPDMKNHIFDLCDRDLDLWTSKPIYQMHFIQEHRYPMDNPSAMNNQ